MRGQYEVLVADDSHRIRELIQTRLKNAGVNVTAVSDGQHARKMIEEHAGPARRGGERPLGSVVLTGWAATLVGVQSSSLTSDPVLESPDSRSAVRRCFGVLPLDVTSLIPMA